MHIERNHNVDKEEAIRKIDTFLDDLMRRQFPGGVTIKEPSKSWSDNAMRFSFKAKKGFIGTTISAVIRVNDDSLVMDSDLPGLVTTFVSEDEIWNRDQRTVGQLIPAHIILEPSSALNQVNDQDDDGNYEEEMDQTAANVADEAKKPEHDQDDNYSPKHGYSFRLS